MKVSAQIELPNVPQSRELGSKVDFCAEVAANFAPKCTAAEPGQVVISTSCQVRFDTFSRAGSEPASGDGFGGWGKWPVERGFA